MSDGQSSNSTRFCFLCFEFTVESVFLINYLITLVLIFFSKFNWAVNVQICPDSFWMSIFKIYSLPSFYFFVKKTMGQMRSDWSLWGLECQTASKQIKVQSSVVIFWLFSLIIEDNWHFYFLKLFKMSQLIDFHLELFIYLYTRTTIRICLLSSLMFVSFRRSPSARRFSRA